MPSPLHRAPTSPGLQALLHSPSAMACMMALPPERQEHIAELESRAAALQRSREALAAGDPQAALALLQHEGLAECGDDSQQRQPQQAGDGSEELLAVIQIINQQQEGVLREQQLLQHLQRHPPEQCDQQRDGQASSCGQEDEEEQECWEEGGVQGQYEQQQQQQEEEEGEEEYQGSEADVAVALGAYEERRYRQYMQQVGCRSGWPSRGWCCWQRRISRLLRSCHCWHTNPRHDTHHRWPQRPTPPPPPSPLLLAVSLRPHPASAPQVDADMARRAQRGAAAGQLEAGYESDVEEEERALLGREQALGPGGPLQQQLEQQRRRQLQEQLEEQQVGPWRGGPRQRGAACK
jgi:hypothetical protein